jgi:hypothetical protein
MEEGNIAHKHCTACQKNFDLDGNELAAVSVPKLPAPAPEPEGNAVVIAAVLAGGAVVVGGGSWALWFVLKRKRI